MLDLKNGEEEGHPPLLRPSKIASGEKLSFVKGKGFRAIPVHKPLYLKPFLKQAWQGGARPPPPRT